MNSMRGLSARKRFDWLRAARLPASQSSISAVNQARAGTLHAVHQSPCRGELPAVEGNTHGAPSGAVRVHQRLQLAAGLDEVGVIAATVGGFHQVCAEHEIVVPGAKVATQHAAGGALGSVDEQAKAIDQWRIRRRAAGYVDVYDGVIQPLRFVIQRRIRANCSRGGVRSTRP